MLAIAYKTHIELEAMARAIPTWRIFDPKPPGPWTGHIDYACPNCGAEAMLPVIGRVLSELFDGSLIFESGERYVPRKIECRYCRTRFESEGGNVSSGRQLEGSPRDVR